MRITRIIPLAAAFITRSRIASGGPVIRRQRQTPEGRLYGASLVGVGAGSLIYHVSSGAWRSFGRKLDYWCIALSSTALLRAVRPRALPGPLSAAAVAMTPFQPFVVTACNGAAMEVGLPYPYPLLPRRPHHEQRLASRARPVHEPA